MMGMNWLRNANYYEQSAAKRDYHEYITSTVEPIDEPFQQYKVHITVFYRNAASDGSNISSLMEKFVLDALQDIGVVAQDSVHYHLGTSWSIGGQDKLNPRCEITVIKEG